METLASGYSHTATVNPSRFYCTGSGGPLTTSDEQSVTVLAAFFERLFNRASSYDGAYILARVPQRDTLWHLADPPTHGELIAALHATKTGTVPGRSGEPPEAYRALLGRQDPKLPPRPEVEESLEYLRAAVHEFWMYERPDPSWLLGKLSWPTVRLFPRLSTLAVSSMGFARTSASVDLGRSLRRRASGAAPI